MMKISVLIQHLEQIHREHGEIIVTDELGQAFEHVYREIETCLFDDPEKIKTIIRCRIE